jgi:hypothetical protein
MVEIMAVTKKETFDDLNDEDKKLLKEINEVGDMIRGVLFEKSIDSLLAMRAMFLSQIIYAERTKTSIEDFNQACDDLKDKYLSFLQQGIFLQYPRLASSKVKNEKYVKQVTRCFEEMVKENQIDLNIAIKSMCSLMLTWFRDNEKPQETVDEFCDFLKKEYSLALKDKESK